MIDYNEMGVQQKLLEQIMEEKEIMSELTWNKIVIKWSSLLIQIL